MDETREVGRRSLVKPPGNRPGSGDEVNQCAYQQGYQDDDETSDDVALLYFFRRSSRIVTCELLPQFSAVVFTKHVISFLPGDTTKY